MAIRNLKPDEITILGDFAPAEWNYSLSEFLDFYFREKFFRTVVAVLDGQIAGTGNAFCFGTTGWLANIIVLPEYRRQGIGTAITGHLASGNDLLLWQRLFRVTDPPVSTSGCSYVLAS
ncbi:MAG: GNAT family N-acetyltransferase [Bacteroidales bacterium]|nr:GNAT family N-acetyltransferase [Bacteroidales bacterium]